MPLINIRTVKGLLDEDKKQELYQRITELMVEIEGGGDPDFKKYVWILLEEHDASDWSISGVTLTEQTVREIKGKLV
ncbi:tautomerase family protein [Mastigocoleus testarum]|uniref:4-oxalocrotonate tautomerase n=1 Tax=Mastigocoleus testarum BC008 TaxID=371196 RepID=A0A0V7ZWY0_9CYAN|nr:tautomerase family protein [Mastigocoleus testarum]KST68971.1 4-oxalocrotonate tautomerase [Mastigocoleus testarum BC008]